MPPHRDTSCRILAVNPCTETNSSFCAEVKCIRCDWLILQTISRWPTEALESCFRKVLTNLTKDDNPKALQLLGCTKLGYENIFSWDFGLTCCKPLPVIPQRLSWGNSSLQVMVTTSCESWAGWMHCQCSVSKASALLFAGWWHQPDVVVPDLDLTWLKLCGARQGTARAVYMS